VNQPPNHKLSTSRANIRMDARLDSTTRAKVDDLAKRFHQPRAAVLCHIMQWGLSREQTGLLDQGESNGPVRHLHLYVASDLRERAEKAATAAGANIARWLRYMVRQMTMADFPASWQEAIPGERSHDSRTYGTRFMLRLDDSAQTKLQQLVKQFGASKAQIIRQLIAQAEPEDFPPSWHMKAAEHRAHPSGQDDGHRRPLP
jgi:predicted transcriptional regulator